MHAEDVETLVAATSPLGRVLEDGFPDVRRVVFVAQAMSGGRSRSEPSQP